MRYTILILALLAASCSPQRRFTRLIDRHPELVLHITDTLILSDTVIVPELWVDTTWVALPVDTLTLYDTISNTTVRIIRVVDTLHISVTSPPDTIYIDKLVPVDSFVDCPDPPAPWRWLAVGALIGLVVIGLLRFVLK